MIATIRGLLHHIHEAKLAVDREHNHPRKRAIPITVTRTLPWQGITIFPATADSEHPAPTPYPWMDIESLLIERRMAHAAPTLKDYIHWMGAGALCANPIHGGATPAHELLSHYVEIAYMNASVCYHHNQTTRSAWTGEWEQDRSKALVPLAATPPAPLGLPLDQGATDQLIPQQHFLRVDNLTVHGRWAVLHSPATPPEGTPVNADSLDSSLKALPSHHRQLVSEGSIYRRTRILLQGFEWGAD